MSAVSRAGRRAIGVLIGSLCLGGALQAAVRTTVASGTWSDPAIWNSAVPGPADVAVIAQGHAVVFDSAADAADECARLLIDPGAQLTFAAPASDFHVGGNGAGITGGIDIRGLLEIPAGITVHVDPDGNRTAAEDGVVVEPGGWLVLSGSTLHDGVVAAVLDDGGGGEIVLDDGGGAPAFDPSQTRLVWRSGLRKGRWYEMLDDPGGSIRLQADSRDNDSRSGPPDIVVGTASVSGTRVDGQGVSWSEADSNGALWRCAADPEADGVRVRRRVDASTLELAEPYAGGGCVVPDAYVLRDDNRPYPAVPFTEHSEPGDAFRLIVPATLRSRYGSDTALEEQTFVRVYAGGRYSFRNASFESMGNEAWASGEGSGVLISGFDGAADPGGLFDTVEVYRFAGDAGLEWEDSTRFDVDWLFLHWAHPAIANFNEGHGLKFEHTGAAFVFEDVRVHHARIDRTNDDFIWWSTKVGGSSGVYDSIGMYCPTTAFGDSCDGVDTADELESSGGQLMLERNLFAYIGAGSSGSCMYAQAPPQTPGWSGRGWVARDNVCINVQYGECIKTQGTARNWSDESIWAVNNACAAIHGSAVVGVPHVLQNQLLDFGMQRSGGSDGLRGAWLARGNVIRSVAMAASDDFSSNGVAIGTSLEDEGHWAGTSWTVTDNVIVPSVSGLRVASWSSPLHPALGQAVFAHNLVAGHPGNATTVTSLGLFDTHDAPTADHVSVVDNLFYGLELGDSRAGEGSGEAANDTVDRNVLDRVNTPAWSGVLVSTHDQFLESGIDPATGDFEIDAGAPAWLASTTDGDRPGPRFAGVLESRLPVALPGVWVSHVDPESDDADQDDDALIDRWDNCPALANAGWPDLDGDGAGDACDPDDDGDGIADGADLCPALADPEQLDLDEDGSGDACDVCPLDPTNDADDDGVCGDIDNCPSLANADQLDEDADGTGDPCDLCPLDPDDDADGDGACADTDNCVGLSNPAQLDRDGDGRGDACDVCPLDAADDADGDGLCADLDNCPLSPNPLQDDVDADSVGDLCDNCLFVPNSAQQDYDRDQLGDVCDICPQLSDPEQLDADGNGCGDVCDPLPAQVRLDPAAVNTLALGDTARALVDLGPLYDPAGIGSTAAIRLQVGTGAPLKDLSRSVDPLGLRFEVSRPDLHARLEPGSFTTLRVRGNTTYGCDFAGTGAAFAIAHGQSHFDESDHSSIVADAIRGELDALRAGVDGELGPVDCLPGYAANYEFSVNEDPQLPAPGAGFFYLYRYCDDTGSCSYGDTSAGNERFALGGACP